MSSDNFVAVGLLTRRDLDVLGSGFRRAYPLEETTDFTALLRRIDEVDGKDRERQWLH
jgi:hypothetical protein